jgi:lipid-binding SYLF domain-containing protein
MICPRVFRAAFFFGGAGSDCVLAARDGAGSWSSPAFFSLASGSVGLQFGIQDSEVMMMIMTERGFAAIMDKQFKIGGDASIAFAVYGAGIEGDTTAALRADIVAFSQDRGLFAGVALNGSMLTTDTVANRAYYGQDLAARQIVVQMQANNPGADPLRAMLARWGGAPATPMATANPYPYAPQQPPGAYAPPSGAGYARQPTAGPTPLAPVQQENLPPPSSARHY